MSPQTRQELVLVAVDEWYVPFQRSAKARVLITSERRIGLEEDREVEVRLCRNKAEQWSLILNRMRHEIRDPVWPLAHPCTADPPSGREPDDLASAPSRCRLVPLINRPSAAQAASRFLLLVCKWPRIEDRGLPS